MLLCNQAEIELQFPWLIMCQQYVIFLTGLGVDETQSDKKAGQTMAVDVKTGQFWNGI